MSDRSLSPAPYRTPISGKDGMITIPWLKWFMTEVFQRIGGADSVTLGQLDDYMSAYWHNPGSTVKQQPVEVEPVSSDSASSRGFKELEDLLNNTDTQIQPKIAQLERRISDLENLISMLTSNQRVVDVKTIDSKLSEMSDQIALIPSNPYNARLVHTYGNETINGIKLFTSPIDYQATEANWTVAKTLSDCGPIGSYAGDPLGWLVVKVEGVDRFVPFW